MPFLVTQSRAQATRTSNREPISAMARANSGQASLVRCEALVPIASGVDFDDFEPEALGQGPTLPLLSGGAAVVASPFVQR